MGFSFISWEFLLLYNFLLVVAIPLLVFREWKQLKYPVAVMLGLILFPFLASAIERIFVKADLSFHWLLILLHPICSLVNLILLTALLKKFKRPVIYYSLTIAASFVGTGLLTPFSTSLRWGDLFLGLVPGTVSMDPIIDLYPYLLRLSFGTVAAISLLGIKQNRLRPPVYVATYFLASLLFGVWGGSFSTWPSALKRNLIHHALSPTIEVFVEAGAETISAENWRREFEFHLDRLIEKLPETNFKLGDKPLRIFIFASDDSKAYWTGARRPQVGNFVRGEIYLSEVEPHEDVIAHELAHLIHGRIDAPLRTYFDPFIFEGFAVALSADRAETVKRDAAAIYQTLPEPLMNWPKSFRFFSALPAAASYRLAGAYSSYYLSQGIYPWKSESELSIQTLSEIKLTEAEIQEAKKILEKPSLLKDPRERDCSRLSWSFAVEPTFYRWNKLASICKRSPYLRSYIHFLPIPVAGKIAQLRSLAQDHANGDAALLEEKREEALKFYSECSTSLCKLKSKLIHDQGMSFLRDQLLIHLKRPALADPALYLREEAKRLLESESDDAESLLWLISLKPVTERVEYFQDLSRIRRLKPDERFRLSQAEFYRALQKDRPAEEAKKIARQILLASDFPETAETRVFIDRLAWEMEH